MMVTVLLCSCTATQYCHEPKHYLKKVNTSKPYWVEGTWCVLKKNDRDLENCEVTLHVYDRISGQPVDEATAFFNEGVKAQITSGKATLIVPAGVYNIGITSLNSLPFSVKEIKLSHGTAVEINCYLGSSLQF